VVKRPQIWQVDLISEPQHSVLLHCHSHGYSTLKVACLRGHCVTAVRRPRPRVSLYTQERAAHSPVSFISRTQRRHRAGLRKHVKSVHLLDGDAGLPSGLLVDDGQADFAAGVHAAIDRPSIRVAERWIHAAFEQRSLNCKWQLRLHAAPSEVGTDRWMPGGSQQQTR